MADLSKLSNEELLALRSGDLSQLSSETLLSLRSASPEQTPQPEEQESPSFLDRLKQLNKYTPGAQTMQSLKAVEGMIQKGADTAAEGIAELPEKQNALGKLTREYPTATGLAAGAMSNLPLAIETAIGSKGLRPAANALRRTTIGAVSGPAAQKGIVEARAAAKIPETMEAIAEPRTRKAILEFVDEVKPLIEKGKKGIKESLSTEEIAAMRDKVKRLLTSQKKAAAENLVDPTTSARISDLQSNLTKALTEKVPSLEQPLAEGAASFRNQALLKSLGGGAKSAGKTAGKYAAGVGGGAGIAKMLGLY